mmetsp:Transcript_6682/g.13904  ORF Transcript_6682/g.13904 Transcript_6682/m.13904 type:complete len:408 (-) Transcript_6682:8-1231(-)
MFFQSMCLCLALVLATSASRVAAFGLSVPCAHTPPGLRALPRPIAACAARGVPLVLRAAGTDEVETWRIFGVEVHPDSLDPPKLHPSVPPAAATEALLRRLFDGAASRRGRVPDSVASGARVVRRSLDARRRRGADPAYNFVMDVSFRLKDFEGAKRSDGSLVLRTLSAAGGKKKGGRIKLVQKPGRCEFVSSSHRAAEAPLPPPLREAGEGLPRVVVVVGGGPCGLFAALTIARSSNGAVRPIILERGRPVESRGRDIGALVRRGVMDPESNFAFGEGGAGTWSDGKLTTRIGRNSGPVRGVLEDMVTFGAKEDILVSGSPHLGTDKLVRIMRNMRAELRRLGVDVRFGARATGVRFDDSGKERKVTGVQVSYGDPGSDRGLGSDIAAAAQRKNTSEFIDADAIVS